MKKQKTNAGWIGVDLDGTLAYYDGWSGLESIGEPIPEMVERVKRWLVAGREVRIFTARACIPSQIPFVQAWCQKYIGADLVVTCSKDLNMIELWDDRVVRVQSNSGRPCCNSGLVRCE